MPLCPPLGCSRGNMGLDFDAEIMALLQKHAIAHCNRVGKVGRGRGGGAAE